jgi:hypothetical protein
MCWRVAFGARRRRRGNDEGVHAIGGVLRDFWVRAIFGVGQWACHAATFGEHVDNGFASAAADGDTAARDANPDADDAAALNDIRYQPSKLEQVADATSTVIQKTATKGVEWTVTLFDALLN